MPITAPDSRRASCSSPGFFTEKIRGIILYVEPLPMPLKMNSAMKPTRYSGSERSCEASSTMLAPAAIATKFQKVTRAPPSRSASAPADRPDQRAQQRTQEGQVGGLDRGAEVRRELHLQHLAEGEAEADE